MFDLFHLFLYLHIVAAIVAFGPTFAFPIAGAMGGKEPMHANFMTRVTERISERMVLPLALTMPISGLGIIWFAPEVELKAWLVVGIALYVVAVSIAVFLIKPTIHKVITISSTPPGPGGPPPELMVNVKKVQRFGAINGILILVIVFLMVVKPGS